MKSQRLYFIDAVRAFAILMMLQGHFVDTLLNPIHKDLNNQIFLTWLSFRGITAPVFFTISGFIFSYLLIKAKQKGQTQLRIRKGIIRGFMLILIGYVLRIPVLSWLKGNFSTHFLAVDVLQCIGLSLILIIFIYLLCLKKTLIFSIIMLLIGLFIFFTEPYYRSLEVTNLPLIISNYLMKNNGSVFTIIPWFGYVCFGGFISTLFYRYLNRHRFKYITILSFFITGFVLIYLSSFLFIRIYQITQIKVFIEVANYNYLFMRLGNVFVLFGFFYLLELQLKQPLILKIGQKTLSIYVIHFIIMYGSFTGYGLSQIVGKTLQPNQAVIGALIFLVSVCVLSFYYVKTNAFLYKQIRKLVDKVKSKSFSFD